MAESGRYALNQPLDVERIVLEAQHRWLRPSEICEILRNHHRFHLNPDPPVRPPAGSLFLFDRKVIRYFRKDSYRWRKKKDGKTVKEAHEKLKANSVDVLHCYYAHGEDNENFQRRSYWMLDPHLEHIVLVHYREVKEGYKSGISRVIADPGSQAGSPQSSTVPCSVQANSPAPSVQTSYASSPNRVDGNGQMLSSGLDDVDSASDPQASSLGQPILGFISHNTSLLEHKVAGFAELPNNPWFAGPKYSQSSGLSNLAEINSLTNNTDGVHYQKFFVEHPTGADFISHKLTDARVDADSSVQGVLTYRDRLITDKDNQTLTATSGEVVQVPQERGFDLVHPQSHNCSEPHVEVTSTIRVEKKSKDAVVNNDEAGVLKKLDSFGRWMDKEIGGDCNESLMASDSGNYWNALDAENDEKEVSSLSRHMRLDTDLLGPSLSQEQLFTIRDFSPDWAYSGDATEDATKDLRKVLIVGTFLVSKELCSKIKWGCMFGEIEVSAEVLNDTVIRCQTPPHAPGRVPFYVTCSNRLACSEVREFEYREKPSGVAFAMAVRSSPADEVHFQMRLVKLLYLGRVTKRFDCSIEDCDKCKLKSIISSIRSESENDWGRVQETSMAFNSNHPRDGLIQILLKDRLCEWLICNIHEGGKGPHVLDDKGQGVIHLAAALGYEWAMRPIVAAGISPNFRDARGRTGLHWASYFGREETVIALLRLGASPSAVDDPTPASPGGKTAADLASSRGYKGIAGYLAEADLISHLSSLTVNENITDSAAATIAAEKSIETAALVQSDLAAYENVSLKGSLAAFRKSARAAALIQAAFRARSFNHRQLTKSRNDISEVSLDLVALGSLNKVKKLNHFEEYLHSSAVKIQQKYRGWKGRKEFLKIRNRIVKIQAHVRGHQVRKQYKKVVWSVSIVEKAILRWRRKGTGLRGFRVEKAMGDVASETEKTDEYEFLRISRKQKFAGVEKALARVRSMVRYQEACDQYMRLVTKFEKLEMGDEGSSGVLQGEISQKSKREQDLPALSKK